MSDLYGEAVAAVTRAMKAEGVTRASLAKRLGVTNAVVSHLLNGSGRSRNLTIAKLERTLDALGYEASFRIRRRAAQ